MYTLDLPFLPGPLKRGLSRLRITQAFSAFLAAMEVASRGLTELRLEVDQPDVIIRPAVSHIKLLELVDVRAVAKLGEQAAVAQVKNIRRAARWHRNLSRRLRSRRGTDE